MDLLVAHAWRGRVACSSRRSSKVAVCLKWRLCTGGPVRAGRDATGVLITGKSRRPRGDSALSAMRHRKTRTKILAFGRRFRGRRFWRGFLGHHGRPRDQAVSWHPGRIPGFHGRTTQQAFEAAYLASGGHGFRSVVNRATLTRSVMRFGHPTLCARNSKQATINSNQAVRPMADGKQESVRKTRQECRADRKYISRVGNADSRPTFAPAVCAQSYTGTGKSGKFGNREWGVDLVVNRKMIAPSLSPLGPAALPSGARDFRGGISAPLRNQSWHFRV